MCDGMLQLLSAANGGRRLPLAMGVVLHAMACPRRMFSSLDGCWMPVGVLLSHEWQGSSRGRWLGTRGAVAFFDEQQRPSSVCAREKKRTQTLQQLIDELLCSLFFHHTDAKLARTRAAGAVVCIC